MVDLVDVKVVEWFGQNPENDLELWLLSSIFFCIKHVNMLQLHLTKSLMALNIKMKTEIDIKWIENCLWKYIFMGIISFKC